MRLVFKTPDPVIGPGKEGRWPLRVSVASTHRFRDRDGWLHLMPWTTTCSTHPWRFRRRLFPCCR